MRCPVCRDEFEPGVARCPDHDVLLVAEGAPPPVPRADALLGRFHPAAAERIVALLARRAIVHDALLLDDEVEVVVDRTYRDGLRSELVVAWQDVIADLSEEARDEMVRDAGNLPGWRDAPTGAWVDRQGRLQVGHDLEDDEEDAQRTLGPSLLAIGAFLILIAWYADADWSTLAYLTGGGAIIAGAFIPR